MNKDGTLTQQDQQRLVVLTPVMSKQTTMAEVAALLELWERQVTRLQTAYEQDGVVGLVHGDRGP